MPDFKLPDLGEGVTEAEIDKWLVKEGQDIDEDTPLVEVITDKATAEIPSPFAGVVARIHVREGQVVPVGTVLVTVMNKSDFFAGPRTSNGGTEAASASSPPPPPPNADAAAAGTNASGTEAVAEAEGRDEAASDGDVKAMPPVRKLARQLGVDLSQVRGSGPGGRILREDVEAAVGEPAPSAAAASASGRTTQREGERREAFRGVRRKIAERMSEAHRIVPPVTHVEECDVTELDATRRLANERSPELQRLTYMPFIVKAVVAGLKEYPALNASLDEDASEIVFHGRYDIGIAVDTPAGLVVPVVRSADKKRLREIAEEVERLATGARAGTLTADDLRDPTFTISSPGPFGGLMATPIVFHPQSAILGVHKASERPAVRDGQVVPRLMMNLSITFDHRILDGMTAAKFILDVVRLLEHPAVLALES
ncbi:MAG: 2-oxo acid dehydrogenase subunit E2 [Actinomycetota bacterium]|nr:2-oxo acid dehydrogenase subunit E2 [Actinomycetota bacterium]